MSDLSLLSPGSSLGGLVAKGRNEQAIYTMLIRVVAFLLYFTWISHSQKGQERWYGYWLGSVHVVMRVATAKERNDMCVC